MAMPADVATRLRALEGRGHLLIRRSPFNRDLGRRERCNCYVFVALQPPVPQRLRPKKRKCVPRGARRHTPRAEVCAPGFETLSLTLKGSAGQCGGCSPARVPPSRRSRPDANTLARARMALPTLPVAYVDLLLQRHGLGHVLVLAGEG